MQHSGSWLFQVCGVLGFRVRVEGFSGFRGLGFRGFRKLTSCRRNLVCWLSSRVPVVEDMSACLFSSEPDTSWGLGLGV